MIIDDLQADLDATCDERDSWKRMWRDEALSRGARPSAGNLNPLEHWSKRTAENLARIAALRSIQRTQDERKPSSQ